jgi:light-regulated signal transduction histidine kinase (bacteriophytochrome)
VHSLRCRAAGFIADQRPFCNPESGRKQYRLASHNAFDLVRRTLDEFADQARARGFRLESDFVVPSDYSEPAVQVDEEALRRAVRNLLDNAMKYSAECRTIWINGALEGNKACISVRDQGMGIAPEEQQAIFQKSCAAMPLSSPESKGSGTPAAHRNSRPLRSRCSEEAQTDGQSILYGALGDMVNRAR